MRWDLKSQLKNLLPVRLARSVKRFKKLNLKQLFKSKKFRLNIGITVFIVFLLVFLGTLVTEKKEKPEVAIELEKVPEVKVVAPKKLGIWRVPRYKPKPKVAIILDDAGGTLPDYSAIFSIEQPITISIIPYLPWSQKIAKDAAYNGFEVMLHMPMEPEDGKYVTNNGRMILSSMPDGAIESMVLDSLKNVKWAVGINNHMGSRATQSRRVMNALMGAIKDKSIYFIDSKTSKRSVAFQVAQRNKVLSACNNIFLDSGTDRASIEAKLKSLVRRAKVHGEAIGIGHATRKQTLEVLKELMPKYDSSGIQFVYVSELVK